MSWLSKGTMGLATLLGFNLAILNAAESTNETGKLESTANASILRLTMNVYNHAGVEDAILRKASQEAGRIFDELGISTEWLDCPLTSKEPLGSSVCRQVGFDIISVRIFPRLNPIQGGFRRTHMGVALVEEQGRVYASVFFQRVMEVAESGRVSVGKVLGHAMAHEIGHLLLGSNSHSTSGLMTANWSPKNLKLLAIGRFHFLPKEGSVMRADVANRNSQARDQMLVAAR